MEFVCGFLLILSLAFNGILSFYLYKKKTTLTTDARQLLAELSTGQAIIKVSVVDPAGLFLRSPRG
jgi:hypothetical protein